MSQDHDYDSRLQEVLRKRVVKSTEQFADEEYDSLHPELEQGKKEGKAYLKRVVTRQSATARKEERVLSSCRFCLANGQLKEEEILSISDHFYLMQPNKSTLKLPASFAGRHLLLVPFSHAQSVRAINEQEQQELKAFKRSIEQYAAASGLEVLFVETAYRFNCVPHAKLEALLAPVGALEQAPIFFAKAFSDIDGEWNTHKKVIAVSKKEGGLFRQVPLSRLS